MDPLSRQVTNQDIYRYLRAIELLRQLDPSMTGQVIATFLYIASHNPCHKQALEEDLGLTNASASRNSDSLCDINRHKQTGMALIRKYPDPSNKRRILLELTESGRRVVQEIERL